MGILDDAIREHLDLKRRHGAQDSEVKRLEDEAFGPPTRPGEPDFPDSEEQPAVGAEAADEPPESEPEAAPSDEAPAVTAEEVPSPGAETASEDATALLEQDSLDEQKYQPAGDPLAEEALADPEPATPEPPSEEQPLEPEAASPEPAAPAEAGETDADASFFDQEGEELELDLDLEDEDGHEDADRDEPASEEMPAEPAPEEPVAGMETAEHPMEDLLGDEVSVEEAAPAPEPTPTEEAPPPEPEPGEEQETDADDADEDDEDVLEETPEFLRDQPEDDELWFEQGEPKDFDF